MATHATWNLYPAPSGFSFLMEVTASGLEIQSGHSPPSNPFFLKRAAGLTPSWLPPGPGVGAL